MTDDLQAATTKRMAALERWMAPIFEKAPHLPQNIRQTIVDIAPWLALIFGILAIFGLVSAGMIGSIMSMFSIFSFGFRNISMLISMLAGLGAAVLQLLAYQPLTRKEKKGWNYIFYGTVLSVVAALVNIIVGYGYGAPGHIIGALIGFWLLFEIRGFYHEGSSAPSVPSVGT